jgi:diguanylate cyclase (GGDEF)-like protein
MQLAEQRDGMPTRVRRSNSPGASPVPFAPGDSGFLEALPIAAGIFTLKDGKLWVLAVNRRFLELAGCNGASGQFADMFRRYSEGEGGAFIRAFLVGEGDADDEMDLNDGDGPRRRFLKIKLAPIGTLADGTPKCLVSVVDRTVEIQAENALRAEMLRDSLTGLPNRLAFTEETERVASTEIEERQHGVLVIDVLRFSRINESMGSIAGDELLITFARRLMSALRAGDVLARTGGNEFGILVSLRRGIEDALTAADRIQDVMAAPFHICDLDIRVECAIGVAMMQGDQEAEELFRNAQFAVKQAKQIGKPQIYEPKEASLARRRFSIETELRRALEKDQLRIFYQPLINLKSGEVAGFEALARWTHPDRGEISPSEFIPVAEESGLILQLGRWAMNTAAHTLAKWDETAGEKLPVYVAVNLSAIQLARDDVAGLVADTLKSSGLTGDRLTLELTESAIIQDPARATRVFDALKALDTTVAMDDFGTGYSSLAYLQRLPIDVLKIDKSFVTGMMVDPDAVAIVRAVLSLADALGMSTTAEGIETVELATTLAALGCASGQGFYFARPLESDSAVDYWRARRRKA